MCGDKKGGFTVFWADDGLDTGPILLQKSTYVDPNETVDSFYNRFCFPEGIKAMVMSRRKINITLNENSCRVFISCLGVHKGDNIVFYL